MYAWRIATDTPEYLADDLTGTGARITGGRWNRKGTSAVYASSSISLACLETVVHLGVADLPLNRYLVKIDVPDELVKRAVLFDAANNVGWDALPAGRVSLDAGDAWLKPNTTAIMIVPSVIVPEEVNYLINPLHADAATIRAQKVRRWTYDARVRSR